MTNGARLIALISVGACLSPAVSSGQRAPGPTLVGTWRLVEHWDKDSAGAISHEYGPQPIGLFIHDVTGHFSVQIMRTPAARTVPVPTDSEAVREFFEGYYAAFGTFTIDTAKGESVYHVEGSTEPGLSGSDARLPFRISSDSLIIGNSRTWRRVWLRVR
ncbi:MAG: lipocalin-like domain-containing protein [Gemmatimonadales bacterium]